MKQLIYSLLFIAALTVGVRSQEQLNYFKQYSSNPLPVINRTGGGEAKLFLVGIDGGDLLFRYQPNDNREIGVPLDTDDLQLYFPPQESVVAGVKAIDDEAYDFAIEQMRPYVYPMTQYLGIPPDKFNIHPYVERYAYALVQEPETLNEAAYFFQLLPIKKLSPIFTEYAMTAVLALVEQGNTKDALAILNKLPILGQETLTKRIMVFANKLRREGNYEEALFLYQRLQDDKDEETSQIARLWMAYCNLVSGRDQTARIFLDQIGDLKPENPAFSLRQLILGRIDLESDQYFKAMEKVSRGVVRADVGSDWAPELIYTSGFCYENLGNLTAAREVYKEVALFYPKSVWGKLSAERSEALPAPEPTPEPASDAS